MLRDRQPGCASRAPRPELGRALTWMFLVGGGLALLIMEIPHWEVEHPRVLVGTGLGSVAAAPVLWLLRNRLPGWSYHLSLVMGTLATTVGVLACGPSTPVSMSGAYFYFWVVLYSSAYFEARAATGHLALVAVAYAAALASDPSPAATAQWLQAVTALTVTALVVGRFSAASRRLATTDALTGLANRRRLDEALPRVAGRAPRGEDLGLTVAVLDLDDFKAVNDASGHAAGDELLHTVAASWAKLVRGEDVLGRLGGDEFLLIAPESNAEGVVALVDRLRASVPPPCGLSAGVVQVEPGESVTGFIRRADDAMYEAKRRGKGITVVAAGARALASVGQEGAVS